MASALLFLLGAAAGSFINVLAGRYRESGRIFTRDVLFGRSGCPHCGRKLTSRELIPIASFVFQRGRCRNCASRLSFRYPASEIAGGLLFTLAPLYGNPAWLWALAGLTLLFISLVDLRLFIIPDQANIFLILLGAVRGDWLNQAAGMGFGAAALGAVFLATRGKGMGFGDVKLAGALGFLFGAPKIFLIVPAAFVIGGAFASAALLMGRKSPKDALPFGPFLAAAAMFVLLFGDFILDTYGHYFQIFF